jgi:hypothetical protein
MCYKPETNLQAIASCAFTSAFPKTSLHLRNYHGFWAGNLTRTWGGKSEMPKYVTILGTSHDLQGAEKRKSSVNDPTLLEAIEFLLSGIGLAHSGLGLFDFLGVFGILDSYFRQSGPSINLCRRLWFEKG